MISVNCYRMAPDAAIIAEVARRTGRPVLIGEWHMGATDRGLPATGLRAVGGQAERAQAYRAYLETAAVHPDLVGAHWFQCSDQAALGRFDGESYPIGIVGYCHRQYPELCAAASASHERLYALVASREQPACRPPQERRGIAC